MALLLAKSKFGDQFHNSKIPHHTRHLYDNDFQFMRNYLGPENNEMILISKTDLAQILNCLKLLTVKLSWKLQLAAALLQNLN